MILCTEAHSAEYILIKGEREMYKKLIALTLTFAMLTGCGAGASSSATTSSSIDSPSSTVVTSSAVSEGSSDVLSELDALGKVEVEKNLFDVTVTLPAEYVGEQTQEDLDSAAAEIGYKVTLNEDGSATYTMTKAQHKELLASLATSMQNALSEMAGSEDYPNITDVSANNDFTSFTITTQNEEIDMAESFAVLAMYMYGGMYGCFNGKSPDNIHVDYVNADSGKVISSADSKDLE